MESKWTRDRPTKPGWYWVHYPGMRVVAVELIKGDFIHGYPVDIWVGRFEGFLWQGPITPDGEVEES